MWPCHSVYRETARVERMISLLDLLTAPATISNSTFVVAFGEVDTERVVNTVLVIGTRGFRR